MRLEANLPMMLRVTPERGTRRELYAFASRQAAVDVPRVAAREAEVVIPAQFTDAFRVDELRAFEGKLYRSIGPLSEFGEALDNEAFEFSECTEAAPGARGGQPSRSHRRLCGDLLSAPLVRHMKWFTEVSGIATSRNYRFLKPRQYFHPWHPRIDPDPLDELLRRVRSANPVDIAEAEALHARQLGKLLAIGDALFMETPPPALWCRRQPRSGFGQGPRYGYRSMIPPHDLAAAEISIGDLGVHPDEDSAIVPRLGAFIRAAGGIEAVDARAASFDSAARRTEQVAFALASCLLRREAQWSFHIAHRRKGTDPYEPEDRPLIDRLRDLLEGFDPAGTEGLGEIGSMLPDIADLYRRVRKPTYEGLLHPGVTAAERDDAVSDAMSLLDRLAISLPSL